MKYIDSNKLSDPQFKRYTGISWSTFYLMVEQLKKHVPTVGQSHQKKRPNFIEAFLSILENQ